MHPCDREGTSIVGFQLPDVETLGHHVLHLDGVTGVWLLSRSPVDALMWVTVAGFGPEAALARQRVYQTVENFLAERRSDMRDGRFVFDYFVLVDDDDLGDPQVPDSAERLVA